MRRNWLGAEWLQVSIWVLLLSGAEQTLATLIIIPSAESDSDVHRLLLLPPVHLCGGTGGKIQTTQLRRTNEMFLPFGIKHDDIVSILYLLHDVTTLY